MQVSTMDNQQVKKEGLQTILMKKSIANRIVYVQILQFLFFFLPIAYIGNGTFFTALKLFLSLVLFYIVNQIPIRRKTAEWAFIIFIGLLGLFIVKNSKATAIPSFIIFCSTYLIVFKTSITFHNVVDYLANGCLCAGLLGFLYMVVTGTYVKGGNYTENAIGISNLTTPLYLALYIIYIFIKLVKQRRRMFFRIALIVVLFAIIFLLEKRGPLIFCVLSIIISLILNNVWLKKSVLIVLFIFPVYEVPLTIYLINNQKYIELFFNRLDDFEELEENPRIRRLYVAEKFISDRDISDLFGYHEELIIAKDKYDTVHNHFHNALLQLYYERGFLSVLLLLIILLTLKEKSKNSNSIIMYALLVFLLAIGTNESLFKSASTTEFLATVLLLFAKKQ